MVSSAWVWFDDVGSGVVDRYTGVYYPYRVSRFYDLFEVGTTGLKVYPPTECALYVAEVVLMPWTCQTMPAGLDVIPDNSRVYIYDAGGVMSYFNQYVVPWVTYLRAPDVTSISGVCGGSISVSTREYYMCHGDATFHPRTLFDGPLWLQADDDYSARPDAWGVFSAMITVADVAVDL